MANIGKVTQVIGSTLDAQFAEDQLPSIYNASKVDIARKVLGAVEQEVLWCEVAQHLGGGRVRAVALGSTDGLARGSQIVDTGAPVTVPVGEAVPRPGVQPGRRNDRRPRPLDRHRMAADPPGRRRRSTPCRPRPRSSRPASR